MFMTAATLIPFIESGDFGLLKGRHVYLQLLAPGHREILRPPARDER
jgi:hypothetical protein